MAVEEDRNFLDVNLLEFFILGLFVLIAIINSDVNFGTRMLLLVNFVHYGIDYIVKKKIRNDYVDVKFRL